MAANYKMGIKKLNSFLQSKNAIILHETYDTLQYKSVCIDVNLYIYKYLYSWGNFEYSFMNQIYTLLTNGIVPVYVFEGIPPKEKENVLYSRKKRRDKISMKIQKLEEMLKSENQNYDFTRKDTILNDSILKEIKSLKQKNVSIEHSHIDKLKKLFDLLDIPYIQSVGESDVVCAKLCKEKYTDMCLSEDLDILVYGCPVLIKIVRGKIYEYNLNHILQTLKISFQKFVDFCIFLGTDYSKPIIRVPNELYQSMTTNKMCKLTTSQNIRYHEAKNIFENAILKTNINFVQPQVKYASKQKIEMIYNFMKQNQFELWKIKKIIQYIYKVNKLINCGLLK